MHVVRLHVADQLPIISHLDLKPLSFAFSLRNGADSDSPPSTRTKKPGVQAHPPAVGGRAKDAACGAINAFGPRNLFYR